MRIRLNQRGVALMLVLGTITILTSLVADFGMQSQIQVRLALADRDRLQAEYLARSAINLTRLLMVKERGLKQVISQLSNGAIDPKMPLCTQFPFSTEMLRGLLGINGEGSSVVADESATPATDQTVITAFDREAAADFFSFRGDFDTECHDESGKFNLNIFASLDPSEKTIGGLNPYDSQKHILMELLRRPAVKVLLGEDSETRIPEVVRNIADWIDTNTLINESPGVQSGSEMSVYSKRGADFIMRNGKMATMDEAYLIEGVTDDWFAPVSSMLSIYGRDKINVCTAEPMLVESLVLSYAANNARIPPINPDNKELLDTIVATITADCAGLNPSPQIITQHVEGLLTGQASPSSGGNNTVAAAGGAFSDMIDLNPGPFEIVGTGKVLTRHNVDGSEQWTKVRIVTILDNESNDPAKWKTLYWRLD